MSRKLTIASDWLAGCAGCHMSMLDMDERILELLKSATFDATPITDKKKPDAGGVDIGILEGCVNNSANEHVALQMRQRCKTLVALGDCAVFGGVPSLRNRCTIAEAMRRAYEPSESTEPGPTPNHEELAVMQDARAVDQVVTVDVHVPGCPPSADAIFYVLSELAAGRKPVLKGDLLDWH